MQFSADFQPIDPPLQLDEAHATHARVRQAKECWRWSQRVAAACDLGIHRLAFSCPRLRSHRRRCCPGAKVVEAAVEATGSLHRRFKELSPTAHRPAPATTHPPIARGSP